MNWITSFFKDAQPAKRQMKKVEKDRMWTTAGKKSSQRFDIIYVVGRDKDRPVFLLRHLENALRQLVANKPVRSHASDQDGADPIEVTSFAAN